MRTVSDTFDVAQPYVLAVAATVTDPQDASTTVEIVDGSVTLDQTAATRGRADVTIIDDGTLGLVPTSPASLLAPYGNEIALSRGITYPDGTSELVGLGVFRIQAVDVDDSADGMAVRISGLDRSARVIDARFEEPYQIAAGTNYTTAILATVQAAWPDVPYSLTSTGLVTPALVAQEGDDRWKFCQDMAAAISMRLYFDGDGVLTLVPDVMTAPVMTIAEGENGVLIQASRNWTREGAYNAVIATGENTGQTAPARGVAVDNNPLSPTYYYGPFGHCPRFYSSPFLTTNAQAAAAAQTMLDKQLGTTEQVSFGALVMPHLEPGDTATITRSRSGIGEDHVLDSLTIPLTPDGVMSGRTRARQVMS